MRYKHLLSEEQLDEIRMSPGALRKFAASPEADGIRAGFEAELVFTGLGTDDDQEWEPDYDADERAYSIQQVVEFFQYDEWGYGMSDREATRLEERLGEAYYEWYDDQVYSAFREEADNLVLKVILDDEWDWDDAVRNQLNDMELSDDEIEEAMRDGEQAPKFTSTREQEAYAETHPGYQRYLEAYEAAESILNDLVDESVKEQDKYWDQALDDFRDGYSLDDDSGFFSDLGLRWMSDISNEFNLGWPHMTVTGSGAGSFDESNAENLATDLEEVLGVKAKVSGGYAQATRDDETWIFEPDSSIDADDGENMPVEIISPPMPLPECLDKIEKFFAWAEDNGAYANSSTGFHMGVSLPQKGGDVDYLKLALFLGDEYILREFGRTASIYTESALKKIRQRIGVQEDRSSPDIAGAMELMRYNLIELAQKQLAINNHGFGKYTSINPKGGVDSTRPEKERPAKYIEFRSAGGTNYFEDIEKLQNTLMRYARAMSIAANPAAERREYYTKLYKLLTPKGEATSGVDLFTEYATGKINAYELKRRWAETALAKDAPELTRKGDWVVIDRQSRKIVVGQEYNNFTQDEVRDRAKQKISPGSSDTDFDLAYEVVPYDSGKWEVYAFDPDFDKEETTLEIVSAPTRGAAVDSVYDKYNAEKIPFKVRPWYGDAQPRPEPKLTPRAQLAKRIKQPAKQLSYNYEIVNQADVHLPVVDKFYAATEKEAQEVYSHWLKLKDLPDDTANYGYRPIQIQAKIGQPQPVGQQQVHDENDVPVWEIYQRDNGHVVHTFANLQQSSAWTQAQQWLRDIGAEPSAFNEFSVRPKIATNETIDIISGTGAVPPRSVTQPPKQPPVPQSSPAVKVDVDKKKQDTYAQTYKKIREWEEIVESMIIPVGRLGQ
jgi:hypothetical protein